MQYYRYLLWWLAVAFLLIPPANSNDSETCLWQDNGDGNCSSDQQQQQQQLLDTSSQVFKTMKFRIRDQEHTFQAYVQPDIAMAYNQTPGSRKALETNFRGTFGKFINLSNQKIRVYWQPADSRQSPSYISDISPFGAAGTATYPGHVFFAASPAQPTLELRRWTISKDTMLYSYDPYGSIENATKQLSVRELELYKLQQDSLVFSNLYRRHTGREWIALYGRKHAPRYPLWPADRFGQVHTIVTNHTHLVTMPPEEVLLRGSGSMVQDLAALQPYRDNHNHNHDAVPQLILNLTVLSVAPRAFEIRNFLSPVEVQHLRNVADALSLTRSTTRAGSAGEATTSDATRTSRNHWIRRSASPVVDLIYRRAADLLQLDKALLRQRQTPEERALLPGHDGPICERLQLVHYAVGQQYTPHHDFSVPDLSDGQASRFATILLYLNDVEAGGETSFPRWSNAHTTEILKVTPQAGKAILFYNQLPDGNYDERSEHAALPVMRGEKWLTNLWVWDPWMH